MQTVPTSRFLRSLLLSVLGLVAAAGAARADLVTGVWDPLFGNPFGNLGFRGVVVYDIPGACLSGPGGQIFNTDPCSGGNMSTVSTAVEFYDVTDPGLATLDTLVFDPLAIGVDYVDVLAGAVIGVGTGYAPWVSANTAFEGASGYFFSIYLSGNVAQMVWKPSGSGLSVEAAASAGQLSNPATVRFSTAPSATVPEPGSLALVGAALAAAALTARRQHR
jgi:PEP-CTERM motif